MRKFGQDILQSFYTGALAGMPKSVWKFIETRLIQSDRYRGSYPVELALEGRLIAQDQLKELTNRHRIRRIDQQLGTARIELIHDRLVGVVRQVRNRRRARTKARQTFISVLIVTASLIGNAVLQWQHKQKVEKEKQELVDMADSAQETGDEDCRASIAAAQSCMATLNRAGDEPVASNSTTQLRSRVYIHIRDDTQRSSAKEIQNLLRKMPGFVVPGIGKANAKRPNRSLPR